MVLYAQLAAGLVSVTDLGPALMHEHALCYLTKESPS